MQTVDGDLLFLEDAVVACAEDFRELGRVDFCGEAGGAGVAGFCKTWRVVGRVQGGVVENDDQDLGSEDLGSVLFYLPFEESEDLGSVLFSLPFGGVEMLASGATE